ncbi:RNA-directed DNA polymerase, eukaryota, reverse transcriptase zinc-binding domain protein [Tanacetum coccineum]
MDIPAISCPSCNANVESANHVFFECDIATDMWKLVFRCWRSRFAEVGVPVSQAMGDHHNWNSWIPRKVNICVWRASLNGLPTRVNLSQRGVNILTSCCPFCGIVAEEIEHHTIRCPRVVAIWKKWRKKVVKSDLDLVASIVDGDIFPSIQRFPKLWIYARIKPRVAN